MPALPEVRSANVRDLDALVALWAELMSHHARLEAQYRPAPGAPAAWREKLEQLLSSDEALVLVRGEELAPEGFCVAELRRAPRLLAEPGRAEITDLFVRAAARRRGAGRALVDAALAWIRGRGIVRVEVRVATANAEGQAFWRALGWGDFVDVLQRRL